MFLKPRLDLGDPYGWCVTYSHVQSTASFADVDKKALQHHIERREVRLSQVSSRRFYMLPLSGTGVQLIYQDEEVCYGLWSHTVPATKICRTQTRICNLMPSFGWEQRTDQMSLWWLDDPAGARSWRKSLLRDPWGLANEKFSYFLHNFQPSFAGLSL